MTVLSLQDERLERQLKRLMERIKQTQDADTRRVLLEEFTALHGTRSPEQVRTMEEARGLNA